MVDALVRDVLLAVVAMLTAQEPGIIGPPGVERSKAARACVEAIADPVAWPGHSEPLAPGVHPRDVVIRRAAGFGVWKLGGVDQFGREHWTRTP